MPVTRFIVRRPEHAGGLTIRLVEGDPQSCVIRFFDTNGADLSEDAQRKVERLFGREDFRRVFPAEIGDIGFPPRALEQYTAALEATVDIEAIRAARFKVVVDYAYGSTSFVMPNVLAKLGRRHPRREPLRLHRGGGRLRPDRARRAGGRLRAGLRRPPRGGDRPRRRAPHARRRPRPRAHRRADAARPAHPGVRAPRSATRWPCRSPSPATPRPSPAPHGVRVRRTKLSTPGPDGRRRPSPGSGFAASTDGGYILPGFLPAFDAAATLVKLLELLARSGHAPVGGRRGAAPHPPRPRDRGDAVGAEGHGDAHARRDEQGPRGQLIDGVKVRHDDGWALALPDPEEPVTHIWAEARHRRRGQGPGHRVRPPHPPAASLSDPSPQPSTGGRGFL